MFRTKPRAVPPSEEHLTGLERAKLERLSPLPQPVQASATPQPPPRIASQQSVQSAPVLRPVAAPAAKAAPLSTQSQMIVGPGVVLKGNVLNCEVLRVEGTIEGDVKARKISVSAGGALLGTAEVEEADIEGRFEGTLAVTGLLHVHATGRLAGKFSYGALEIKRGGELAGEMEVAARPRARAMEVVRQAEPSRPSDPARALKSA